jgi:hypothetical protein
VLNGKPVFLYGISYYGALGASEEAAQRDLDAMQRHGFNWFRMWANWQAFDNDVGAVDAEGRPRELFLKKLEALIAECDRRGMVVDVSLSRGNGVSGPARLQTPEAHQRAVETLMTALQPLRNWYLDLSNERNIRDRRHSSFDHLKALRETAHRLDERRLITASHAGDIPRDDLGEYLQTVRVDFISPHRPRNAESAAQTEAKTGEYHAWMKEIGRVVPVHYQEPFRRDFGRWQPVAADFITDARGAKAGEAAGWCLHNSDARAAPDGRPRRSFDLRDGLLFDQLDAEERAAVETLRSTFT